MSIWDNYRRRRIRKQAALWHTRIGRGLSGAERRGFETWIADPDNAREFQAQRSLLDGVADLKGPQRADLLGSVVEAQPAVSTRALWASYAAIAFVAISGVVGWTYLRNAGYVEQTYRTATGQIRSVVLPDGSIVNLNTQTEIEWIGSPHDRRLRLLHGEAFFQVVHDPSRPFRIILAHSLVQVLGTSFDVYQMTNGDVRVSVISGTVAVEGMDGIGATPSWTRRLTAGQQIEYSPVGLLADVHSVAAAKVIRWREGMLETQGEQLSEFISDLSRYTPERIVIADPRIATEIVGGAFNIRNIDETLNRLSRIARVTVTHENGEVILGYRPGPTHPRQGGPAAR